VGLRREVVLGVIGVIGVIGVHVHRDATEADGTDVFEFTTIYFADGFEDAALRMTGDLDLMPGFVAPIEDAPSVEDLPTPTPNCSCTSASIVPEHRSGASAIAGERQSLEPTAAE